MHYATSHLYLLSTYTSLKARVGEKIQVARGMLHGIPLENVT